MDILTNLITTNPAGTLAGFITGLTIGLTIGLTTTLLFWQHDPQAVKVVWRWLMPFKPLNK